MALTQISTAGVKDDAVTAGKIPANAVGSSELADNAVDTAAIAADAVTGAKIADDAINSEHYTDGSIDTAHIADAQVTAAKLASDSVTSAKINDQAVTLNKLPHGDGSSNGKFLRSNNGADPTWETVTGTTINNNADNRIITGSGTANTLEGESTLTYDGDTLLSTNTNFVIKSIDTNASNAENYIQFNAGYITYDSDASNSTGYSGHYFQVDGSEKLRINNGGQLVFDADTNTHLARPVADTLAVTTSGTERMRIDSSGRLLVGTSTASSVGDSQYSKIEVSGNTSSATGPGHITIKRGTASASLSSGDTLGRLIFSSLDGGNYGYIMGSADAAPGSSDYPGRITFFTTPDGSSSAAERMRIDKDGHVGVGMAPSGVRLDVTSTVNDVARFSGPNSGNIVIRNDTSNEVHLHTGTSDDLLFGTNGENERMRIDSSGKLMVGGTTADAKFAVIDGSNPDIAMRYNGTTGGHKTRLMFMDKRGVINAQISNNLQNDGVGTAGSHLEFATAYGGTLTNRMFIDQAGKVAIGDSLTSASAGKLQVINESGTDASNDCNAYFETNSSDWNIKTYYNKSGSHYHITFVEQGSDRGYISGNDGSNVTYGSGSDYRWKENVVRMTGSEGIDICKKLKPSKYNWIENREVTGQINTVDGFIAHEVEEAGVLGAVTGEKDAVKKDGSIDGQVLDYGQLTPVLAAGIKGLIDKVETLETKVAALEAA